MLTLAGGNGRQPGVELRPACVLGVPPSGRMAPGDVPDPRGERQDRGFPLSAAETLPAQPKEAYPGPETGWAPSIWEMSADGSVHSAVPRR